MKADELMIGDWVQVPCGDKQMFLKVIGICPFLSGEYYAYTEPIIDRQPLWMKMLEPIPLTPEILEKNHGEETRAGISDKPCWGEMGALWSTLLWKGENSFWLEVSTITDGFVKKHIKYVHELQHALRLLGIDKEITL